MKVYIDPHESLAIKAASAVELKIANAISKNGIAHIIHHWEFTVIVFKALRDRQIEWKKVIIFHLDEYIGLEESHPASFRYYLRENIINISLQKLLSNQY